MDDVQPTGADTQCLEQTVHDPLTCRDARVDAWLADVENIPKDPRQQIDGYLRGEQNPRVVSGKEKEEAPPWILEEKGQRVVQFGIASDAFREQPDEEPQEDGIQRFSGKNRSAREREYQVVMCESFYY